MNAEVDTLVKNIIIKYTPILLLQNFTFTTEYQEELSDDAIAEACFNHPYLNLNIRYSKLLVEYYEKDIDIEPFVVHEMCHAITDPLYAVATERYTTRRNMEDARERATDHVCNIALKAYRDKGIIFPQSGK
jgi:hypothetical protein